MTHGEAGEPFSFGIYIVYLIVTKHKYKLTTHKTGEQIFVKYKFILYRPYST